LTPAEKLAALAEGSSDLKFLLEMQDVDNDLQAMFYQVGVRTIPVLPTFASSIAELKDIVKAPTACHRTRLLKYVSHREQPPALLGLFLVLTKSPNIQFPTFSP